MDGDDAVVDLAGGAAVLPLDPRRLVAFLGTAGIIDDADTVFASVPAGNPLVQQVAHQVVVPAVEGEELLEGAHGDVLVQGDGFGRLAGQVGEQALDVASEVFAGGLAAEAIGEGGKEAFKLGPEAADLCGVHRCDPRKSLMNPHLRRSPTQSQAESSAVVLMSC